MSAETIPPNSKERASTYIYFCSLYFVTVGVLYLWGYWLPFDVNILEYLNLSDIIKATAYPIATAVLATAVGAAIGEGLADREPEVEGDGIEARFWRFVRSFAPALFLIYILGTTALLIFGPVGKWHALPVLFALPLYAYAKHQNLLLAVIPHESSRSIVVFLIAALPFLAFGRGTIAADKITSGSAFKYVTSDVPGFIAGLVPDSRQLPRVIGRAGDHMFFFDPRASSVIIFKPEPGKSVVVKTYSIPPPQPTSAESNSSLKEASADKPASAP